ncbi:MAG TPA: paraquat-inducible protein A [Thermodesulfovibrionia bacterium]|nr:paraquat-inducible protein A [Thermodesulfovibrionia bacterium]
MNRSQIIKLIIGIALFICSSVLTFHLIILLNENKSHKFKIAELNAIKYGLLNANEWVKIVSAILSKKIEEFELTSQNKEELRLNIEKVLYNLIDYVVFPLVKVIFSFLYYYNINNLRHSSFVNFFALELGKWSMADVMVVALFMAYIGFRGLVSSQLSQLSRASKHVEVLTTNGTTLQGGFFLFLGFCIASLVLSTVLKRSVATD